MKAGAGGIAATAASSLLYPFDVVRVRLMSGDPRYRKILVTTKLIWQETHGPRNFFRGLNASLAQRVPDILINFAVYESVKIHAGGERDPNGALRHRRRGPLSALASIAVAFPLDVCQAAYLHGRANGRQEGVPRYLRLPKVRLQDSRHPRDCIAGSAMESVRCVPQVTMMMVLR